MKSNYTAKTLIALNLMALCSVANADLITTDSVFDYSSEFDHATNYYGPDNLLDDSGLTSAGTDAWTHSAGGTDMYITGNFGGAPVDYDTEPWLEFDLGAVTTLTEIHIWNGNGTNKLDRGAQTIDVYVSNTPGTADNIDNGTWTFVETITLIEGGQPGGATGTAGTYLGERFNIADTTGYQYVRLDITANWGSATNTSLSEVHFYNAIPEPGTYALLAGLTGLTYVMLRRRR